MKQSLDQSDSPKGPMPRLGKKGPDGFPTFAPGAGRGCVVLQIPGDRERMACQQQTMQDLSRELGLGLKTVVTDETGLTAKYDLTLSYAGSSLHARTVDPPRPASPSDDAATADPLPDFFSALPSQLGLKLAPKKVGVPVMVVDHIANTPNGN